MTQTARAFAQRREAPDLLRQLLQLARRISNRWSTGSPRSTSAIEQAQGLRSTGADAQAPAAQRRGRAGGRSHRVCRTARASSRRKRSRLRPGRERAARGAVGLGKIDAVPRHLRHLAVRRGPHPHPRRRARDGGAAEALHPDRHAARRRHLSGGAGEPIPTTRSGRPRRRTARRTCRSARHARPMWSQRLSGGEQQRLASPARCSRSPTGCSSTNRPPRWTRSSRPKIYKVLFTELHATTIVSIGHRSSLLDIHQRHIELRPDGDGASQVAEKTVAA